MVKSVLLPNPWGSDHGISYNGLWKEVASERISYGVGNLSDVLMRTHTRVSQ